MNSRTANGRRERRGSALVTSLLLVAVISAVVAGTFSMTASEGQAVGDQEAQSEAYDIARSAYDRFIANPAGALPAFVTPAWTGPDSAYFTFTNGYAYVRVERLVPAVGGQLALYSVRARGVRTAFRSRNTPAAERIFAQYARFQTGTFGALGAWTSLSGLLKTGGSGTISGADACGVAPPVAGVAVPTAPGYTQSGGSLVPTGSPNVLDMGTQTQANSMISIDWVGIVAGTVLTPDITIPPGAWPSFADPNYWPVIYVNQVADFSLPSNGRGFLIVRHNMRLNGSERWDGILLVGGALTSSGANHVSGAVVTGLNVLLGEAAAVSDLGNGNKTFEYNSCNVANAAARLNGFLPLRNTSVDNWPAY